MNQLDSHDTECSVPGIGYENVPAHSADGHEPDTINQPTEPRHSRFLRVPFAKLAVGSLLGSYRIDKYLDRGGMAAVYEALDLRLDRRVALKVLDFELDSEDVDALLALDRQGRTGAHPDDIN